MADVWWRISPASGEQAGRALLYRVGPEKFIDRVLVAWSRSSEGVADASWRALATLPQRWSAPKLPLKAADFITRGVEKGPALGAALRAAEEAWIAAGFPLGADTIKTIADEAARSS
jgi:poly(A) polymerase